MGQQVVALMYGIGNTTKGLKASDGDGYFWEDYSDGVPPEKRLRWDDPKCPRSAYEGGVIGFAVAAGPAHDDDGFLGETTTLKNLEKTHAKHVKAAKQRWRVFAAWALKEHGKRLPKPALWITTDERA